MSKKYLDKTISPEERADILLSEMSIEEKMGQIVGYNPAHWSKDILEKDYPDGVGEVSFLVALEMDSISDIKEKVIEIQKKVMRSSEHNIPAIFHIEAICGVLIPYATSFPSGIGQASTWNPDLQKEMALLISKQMRAMGFTHALAPVLDISRDSRFGRQGETYGEDPTLASVMGEAYVNGIQNCGDFKKGVLACAKHFLGYQNSIGGIHAATSYIPTRVLKEIYAKPFQTVISKANLKSLMNCYSVYNGEPTAGSKYLLSELLRNEMGFNGLTVADYDSIIEQFTRQKVVDTKELAGERSLRAGLDVELPSKKAYNQKLMKKIKEGLISEEILNRSVKNILKSKFELGLFESPYPPKTKNIEKIFSVKNNKKISLQIAKESLVLIKNNGILPLSNNIKKIAIIGHHASSTRIFFGGYTFISMSESYLGVKNTMAGVNITENEKNIDENTYPGARVQKEHVLTESIVKKFVPHINNLLEQMIQECKEKEIEIEYSYGYSYIGDDVSKHDKALSVAEKADVVVLTLGGKYGWGNTSTTGEGIDATNINLPTCQEEFIKKLSLLNKPTIAVHFDGRPISSNAADSYIEAIIEAWTPGEYGAEAIVDTIFGKYNPSGKLPVTVAYNSGQLPLFYNHDNGSSYNVNTISSFKSYVDCPHEPRYYFGHGLSYTRFSYSNMKLEKKEYKPTEKVKLWVNIKNEGDVFGEEVVQLYIRDEYASMIRPVKELVGFKKVGLMPNERKKVKFVFALSQIAFLDIDMKWKIEKGEIKVLIGSSSEDIRCEDWFVIMSDNYLKNPKEREFYATSYVDK